MKNYLKAEHYACDALEGLIVDGEIETPDYTFADSVVHNSPSMQNLDRADGSFYYEISEPMALVLLRLAQQDYRFFDVCVEMMSHNILLKETLPDPLGFFAVEVLRGREKRPSPKHRPRSPDWLKKHILYSLIHEVARKFDLRLTRNDEQKRQNLSACDAVARAATVCGMTATYGQMKQLVKGKENSRLRDEIQAVAEMRMRSLSEPRPQNALMASYYEYYHKQAGLDVLAISRTFPTSKE